VSKSHGDDFILATMISDDSPALTMDKIFLLLSGAVFAGVCGGITVFCETLSGDRGCTACGNAIAHNLLVPNHGSNKSGSLAQFVGKRAVEKDAPREIPKAGLSHSAWKSRKSRAISTFPTASATTNHFPLST
jgi:hypothetical protein